VTFLPEIIQDRIRVSRDRVKLLRYHLNYCIQLDNCILINGTVNPNQCLTMKSTILFFQIAQGEQKNFIK